MISESEKLILLSRVTGFSKEKVLIGDFKLSKDQELKLKELIKKREEGYPIAYILGEKEFFGRNFVVNENVLIPRVDSECLVEEILNLRNNQLRILDMGCGSGCLGITLNLEIPNSELTLCDVSKEALDMALTNSLNLCSKPVTIIESDLFTELEGEKFDIIVSNLPYVEDDYFHESIKYEPKLALYSGDKGMDHYKRFFQNVWDFVKEKFLIGIECDPNQIQKILELIPKDYKSKIFKDLQSLERGVIIYL